MYMSWDQTAKQKYGLNRKLGWLMYQVFPGKKYIISWK